jgi:TPR repeat protein
MAGYEKKKGNKTSLRGEATAYLGMAYELGAFGVKVDLKKAHGYYTSACKQNNALGAFRLAQCFEKGIGKPKSMSRALTFYRCAAKLGLIEALHTYGAILIYGDLGSKRDPAGGLFYLKLATKNSNENYPYPYFDLARCFEADNPIKEIVSDDAYAFELYLKGAKLGCPNCQYRIGRALEYGELGSEKDLESAVFWYNKAGESGQVDAQLALSGFYFTGIHDVLEKNPTQAYVWALRAAVRGHMAAAYCVAEFIESGIGVKRDIMHALWWYTIAHMLGHTRAKAKMDGLKSQIQGKNKQAKKPAKCLLF